MGSFSFTSSTIDETLSSKYLSSKFPTAPSQNSSQPSQGRSIKLSSFVRAGKKVRGVGFGVRTLPVKVIRAEHLFSSTQLSSGRRSPCRVGSSCTGSHPPQH